MATSPELRTSLKQRIGIIIVAIVLVGSTIALYMGIVLSYNTSSQTTAKDSEKEARLNELFSEYQAEVNVQAAELSTTYFPEFSPYKSRVKAFNAAAVTSVTTTDLKIGTGTEITENSYDYSAYYIGWMPDETIFDSSFDNSATPTALVSPLAGGEMIAGWNQGIIGMKLGGIREISIPAELAYGADGRDAIPPDTPLKFIVMLIPQVAELPWSEEMTNLYYELYGSA